MGVVSGWGIRRREVMVVTTFVERFLIDVFGVIEAFFIRRYFGEPSVDGFWDVLQDRWWMVGFFVYIYWDVSFLCVRIVFPTF